MSKKVCFNKPARTVESNGIKKKLRSLDSSPSTDVAPRKEKSGRLLRMMRKWETELKSTVLEKTEEDVDEGKDSEPVQEEFEVEAILDHSKVKK